MNGSKLLQATFLGDQERERDQERKREKERGTKRPGEDVTFSEREREREENRKGKVGY